MAKARKKSVRKRPAKKFIILWSDCGSVSQYTAICADDKDSYAHPSAEAAEKSLKKGFKQGFCENNGVFAIAEIVKVSTTPSDITWADKVDLAE